MDTNKKLIVAFAAVAIGLLLYPPTQYCIGGFCSPTHELLWRIGPGDQIDLIRLVFYELALAIAAGVTYFIRKK